ncbi:MAG: mechanosensitive ion channel family protein [Ignavibacteriales bacterium]|nr:mechanosensitive ion channel family protein [Ignavibacteriales bacterium]
MNQIINLELSEFAIFSILLLGVLLYFFLWIIKKYFIAKRLSNRNQQYYFLVEIIIWVVFGIWALKTFLSNTIYYSIVVITIFAIVAAWIGWFVIRDFIAGVVFKLNDNYQKGQLIKLNEVNGFIEKLNYLNLDLVNENGETIKIPYSKILTSIHFKSFIDSKTKQHKFSITVLKNDTLEKTKELVRRSVLVSPGVNFKKEPHIIVKQEFDDNWIFEINAFVQNDDYCELVEANVRKSLEIN